MIIIGFLGIEDLKNCIFTWSVFVIDFIGIFFVVSFAFYNSDELQIYFYNIRDIYLYLFIIGILPIALIGSFMVYIQQMITHCIDNPIFCVCIFCGFTVFLGIGLFAVILLLEIFCITWIALPIMFFGRDVYDPFYKWAIK